MLAQGPHRAAVVAIVAGLLLLVAASPASAAPIKRTCGLLPGDGAFRYIKTTGVKCRDGYKITNRARQKFCAARNDCEFGPFDVEESYRGEVRYRGWSCRVKVAYEFISTRCEKGPKELFYATGA